MLLELKTFAWSSQRHVATVWCCHCFMACACAHDWMRLMPLLVFRTDGSASSVCTCITQRWLKSCRCKCRCWKLFFVNNLMDCRLWMPKVRCNSCSTGWGTLKHRWRARNVQDVARIWEIEPLPTSTPCSTHTVQIREMHLQFSKMF